MDNDILHWNISYEVQVIIVIYHCQLKPQLFHQICKVCMRVLRLLLTAYYILYYNNMSISHSFNDVRL